MKPEEIFGIVFGICILVIAFVVIWRLIVYRRKVQTINLTTTEIFEKNEPVYDPGYDPANPDNNEDGLTRPERSYTEEWRE